MKFKPQVEAAEPYQRWDLVSALRGPDTDRWNSHAKQFTIAIRRAILTENEVDAQSSRVGGRFDVDYYAGITPEELIDSYLKESRHWQLHIRSAFATADLLNLLDDHGKVLAKILQQAEDKRLGELPKPVPVIGAPVTRTGTLK